MLSILAESLLIATRTQPLRRDAQHNEPTHGRYEAEKRKWYQFAGLRF